MYFKRLCFKLSSSSSAPPKKYFMVCSVISKTLGNFFCFPFLNTARIPSLLPSHPHGKNSSFLSLPHSNNPFFFPSLLQTSIFSFRAKTSLKIPWNCIKLLFPYFSTSPAFLPFPLHTTPVFLGTHTYHLLVMATFTQCTGWKATSHLPATLR